MNISDRIVRFTDSNYSEVLTRLTRAAQPQEEVIEAVRSIISEVRANGDTALENFTAKFDKQQLKAAEFRVTRKSVTPDKKNPGRPSITPSPTSPLSPRQASQSVAPQKSRRRDRR